MSYSRKRAIFIVVSFSGRVCTPVYMLSLLYMWRHTHTHTHTHRQFSVTGVIRGGCHASLSPLPQIKYLVPTHPPPPPPSSATWWNYSQVFLICISPNVGLFSRIFISHKSWLWSFVDFLKHLLRNAFNFIEWNEQVYNKNINPPPLTIKTNEVIIRFDHWLGFYWTCVAPHG